MVPVSYYQRPSFRYEVQKKNADLSKLLTDFVIRWRLMDVLILSRAHLRSPVVLMAFEALDETTEKTFAV